MRLSVKGKLPNLNKASERLKQILPRLIANKAKNHFLEGFKKGGGQTDASSSGWAARKKIDKKNKGKRAILVSSGALRNDLDVRKTTLEEIVLGTNDTVYASFHNDGSSKYPQREFLGDSRKLNNKIRTLIRRQFDKEFKK